MAVNNAGDLRERIHIEYPETVCVAGEDITSWKDLFGSGIPAKVRRSYIR